MGGDLRQMRQNMIFMVAAIPVKLPPLCQRLLKHRLRLIKLAQPHQRHAQIVQAGAYRRMFIAIKPLQRPPLFLINCL